MNEPKDPVAEKAAALSALVSRWQRSEITIVDLVALAYGMGHDHATEAWRAANTLIVDALIRKDAP